MFSLLTNFGRTKIKNKASKFQLRNREDLAAWQTFMTLINYMALTPEHLGNEITVNRDSCDITSWYSTSCVRKVHTRCHTHPNKVKISSKMHFVVPAACAHVIHSFISFIYLILIFKSMFGPQNTYPIQRYTHTYTWKLKSKICHLVIW